MRTAPSPHERARELAIASVDFDLTPDESDELDRHLAGCSACRRFAEDIARDQARLAALPGQAAPPGILAALRRSEARRPDRFRSLLVLATAAMAGTLALATLTGSATPKPTPVPPSPIAPPSVAIATSGPATPSPAPPATTPAASAQPLAWRPVRDQSSFHDPYGIMEAVAAGPRIVAVGDGCGPTLPTCHAAIWTSDDGRAWRRVKDAPEFLVGSFTTARRGEMTDVVAGPDGFVAVGRSREGGARRAAAWWSNDGLRWSRASDDRSLRLGTMEAVVSTPAGLVTVGNVVDGDDARAGAWTSTDGLAWSAAEAPAGAFAVGGPGSFTDGRVHGGMIDVAWTGSRLVAVGSACADAGGACHGVAWTSADGRSWERVSAPIDGTPYALTVADGQLVAAGDDGQGHPISWTSPDGSTWSRGRPVSGVEGNFDALVPTSDGLVGAIATSDLRSVVAASADGLRWRVDADPGSLGGGVINGLAWDPVLGAAIGVGWDGRTPAAAVWVGR